MSSQSDGRITRLSEHTNEETAQIVREHLPNWKLACDKSDADAVILHQTSFGRSRNEIVLMNAAIRYAGIAGKTVTVVP
jgi:hypothetical protein